MANSQDPGLDNKGLPMTPIRRFLCTLDLIQPILALGKRTRDCGCIPLPGALEDFAEGLANLPEDSDSDSSDGQDALPPTSSPPPSSRARQKSLRKSPSHSPDTLPQRSQRPARLAIQHEDRPFDAVVVTTLPCYPFCCHEELLTMSRQKLVEVALLFNSRLPRSRQIDISEAVTNAHIRHSIETLVGIVPDIPGAPKGIKSRTMLKEDRTPLLLEDLDTASEILPSPPTSPLAMRISRRRGPPLMSSPSRALGCLQEEDEEQPFAKKRPLKRRKVSEADNATTPTHLDYANGTIGEGSMSMDLTSPGARFTPGSFEMLFSPASVISSGEGMVLCSPARDAVADSGDAIIASVSSQASCHLG